MYQGEPTAIAASPNANTAIQAPRSRDRAATHASANPSSPNCTSAVAFVPSAKPVSTPATTAQRRSIGGALVGPSGASGAAAESALTAPASAGTRPSPATAPGAESAAGRAAGEGRTKPTAWL